MTEKKWQARTKQDLIIEVWEDLDCESVGARELKQIQDAISSRFGAGAVESPAAIARMLADEGAILRHPEVLDYDTEWRQDFLMQDIPQDQFDFSSLEKAADSLTAINLLRKKLHSESDQNRLRALRELAIKYKQEVHLVAQSKIVEERNRLEAKEIIHWLTIWLQDPDIFEDWLSLRRRSPEFIRLIQE
jgi:hypothetical protein